MQVPVGLVRETLNNAILLECGDLEVFYPTPHFFKFAVANWSERKLPIWEKLIETTQYDYNPIHNYDRHEEHSWTETRSENESVDESRNTTSAGTVKDVGSTDKTGKDTETTDTTVNASGSKDGTSETVGTTADTTNSQVDVNRAAYNTQGYEPVDQTITDTGYNSRVEGNGTTSETTKDTSDTVVSRGLDVTEHVGDTRNVDTTDTGNMTGDIDRQRKEDVTHTDNLYAYGNIGVTTTQQMIEAQREVVKFDIYEYIAVEFKREFCLLVY